MNALIFKKCLEIKNNKLRLISFFILPIMCFLITIYFQIPMEKVAFYCPLCISLLNVLVFWNQENIVLSGDLIFTPLTPQKIWLTNAIFPTIVYYAYCYILLILTISMYCLCFNLSIPFSFMFFLISYNYLSVNLITIAWSNIIGVILLVIALILNKKIDNENILHFSDNNFFSEKNGVIE